MSTITETKATITGESFSRVAFTPEAMELLRKLWGIHGPLMFHQSGGCCDGSSPMCYPAGEFRTGGSDILLGLLPLADVEGSALGRSNSGCPRSSSNIGSTPN